MSEGMKRFRGKVMLRKVLVAGAVLILGASCFVTPAVAAWSDSYLLHNSNRFACSEDGFFSNEAECVGAGGTWTYDRKWTVVGNEGEWGTDGANDQYGPFECTTCHQDASTNIKRIITSVAAPVNSFPGTTVVASEAIPGVSSDYGNDAGGHVNSQKVCEVCHTRTDFHRFDTAAQVDLGHYNSKDCITCHQHSTGFKASCDSCHASPPVDTAGLVVNGSTPGDATGSATEGRHTRHAVELTYACDTCHTGWDGAGQMPNGGDLNIGFVTPGTDGGTYDGRTGGNYTADVPSSTSVTAGNALTCAVYCHGADTPTWDTTDTAKCGSCHGDPNFTNVDDTDGAPTGVSGSRDLSGATSGYKVGKHANHLDDSVLETGDPCALCHFGTLYADSTHVDGSVDVQLRQAARTGDGSTGGAGLSAIFSAGNPGTCSNLDCHGDADWDSAASGGCNFCHGAVDGSSNPQYWPDGVGSGYYDSNAGAHDNHVLALAEHLYSITTLDALRADAGTDAKQKAICAFCHTNPGGGSHDVNGGSDDRVDVNGAGSFLTYDGVTASKTDSASLAYTPGASDAFGTCNNLACHNRVATPNYWGAAVQPTATCATCHTQATFESDAHKLHVGSSALYDGEGIDGCIECHEDHVSAGSFPTATSDVRHADGHVKLVWTGTFSMENNAGDSSVTYSAAGAVVANTEWKYEDGNTGTCASAVCHNNKTTPNFSSTSLTGSNCVICHTAGGHASDVGNPTSGLHTGSAPTVSGQKHDETLTASAASDCVVCHTTLRASTGTHIQGTFTGNANLGLFGTYTNTGVDTGTCAGGGVNDAAGCHGSAATNNGDDGTWARVWNAGIHYETVASGSPCAGCHGGFSNDWTFSEANITDAATNSNIDHTLDWDGDATADESIGNHSNATDPCRSCHVYPDSPYDTAALAWGGAYHGNGSIDMNSTVGYSRSGGSAYGCTGSCHTDNTNHVLADSGWGLNLAVGPDLDCLDCHNGSPAAAGTGLAVTDTSPHAQNHGSFNMAGTGVDTTAGSSQGCKDCHFTSHTTQTTGTVNIANNATMGIDYSVSGGSGVYMKKFNHSTNGLSTNEAETCWYCHDDASAQAAPFEYNNTGAYYKEGNLSTIGWYTTSSWNSVTFPYKTSTIHSTHEVGEHTNTTDGNSDGIYDTTPTIGNTDGVTSGTTDGLNCSWCHDVHNIMGNPVKVSAQSYNAGTVTVAWNDSPTVFLRGTWYSSPYNEDGAPQIAAVSGTTSGFTYPVNTDKAIDENDTATKTAGTWGPDLFWGDDPAPSTTVKGDPPQMVGPNHVVRIQSLGTITEAGSDTDYPELKWGVHIDDNVYGTSGFVGYNPAHTTKSGSTGDTPATLGTVNHIDYSATTNLCMKCHGSLIELKALWAGHNAVNGGTADATPNIFTGNMAIHQHYMYKNQYSAWSVSAQGNLGYAGDLAEDNAKYGVGAYYDWAVDLTVHATGSETITTTAEANGLAAAEPASPGNLQKYHKFTCSKCHSPHASINARLMITNCMNRDGVAEAGNQTFNEREGGPGRVVGSGAATAYQNVSGVTYPDPQADNRDIADPWIATFGGQVRAVQCHNNMVSGSRSTYWQSIQ